jgi:hypothetical protein
MSAAAPAARHAATNNKHAATSKQQNKTADVCLKLVSQISEAARISSLLTGSCGF